MVDQTPYWGMLTPSQVRRASLVVVAGLLCQNLLLPLSGDWPLWVKPLLILFGGFGGWLLLMWIAFFAPGWRNARPGELDERELIERQKVFVISYRITGFGLLAIQFYGYGVTSYAWWPAPPAKTAFALLWSMAWLHLAMPGIILAWRSKQGEESLENED